MYPELIPAYGRDYKSAKDVKADFEAGKDFIYAEEGRVCNKADLVKAGVKGVNIRFKGLRNLTVVKIK